MDHQTQAAHDAEKSNRRRWQEPAILVERLLTANAQGPGPQIGPMFGPLTDTLPPP